MRLSIYLDQYLSKSDIKEASKDLQTSTSLSTSSVCGFNSNSTLLSSSNGEIIHWVGCYIIFCLHSTKFFSGNSLQVGLGSPRIHKDCYVSLDVS